MKTFFNIDKIDQSGFELGSSNIRRDAFYKGEAVISSYTLIPELKLIPNNEFGISFI